jgi:hypothetical protein
MPDAPARKPYAKPELIEFGDTLPDGTAPDLAEPFAQPTAAPLPTNAPLTGGVVITAPPGEGYIDPRYVEEPVNADDSMGREIMRRRQEQLALQVDSIIASWLVQGYTFAELMDTLKHNAEYVAWAQKK